VETIQAVYTKFGETRVVEAEVHNEQRDSPCVNYLWVEREEDRHALMSPQYKDKSTLVITYQNWIKGKVI
jgi:hypothetical protein